MAANGSRRRRLPDDFTFWQTVMEANESILPGHRTSHHPDSRRWKSTPQDLRDFQPQENPLHIRKVDPDTFDW